jgi:hypothetical protein
MNHSDLMLQPERAGFPHRKRKFIANTYGVVEV